MSNERPLVEYGLVKAHIIWAMVFFSVSLLAGFVYSLQFFTDYPFAGISWLSPGRVRMVHTNAIAYGFLVNGFTACMYYTVPRLTGQRVASHKLGLFMNGALQFTVLATAVGILLGKAQGVEWGETPTGFQPGSLIPNWIPCDLLVAVFALCLAWQMATPMIRSRHKRMYVSLWYFAAGLIWTILTYVMGNVVPEWFLPGTAGAAVGGLFIHDLVGLFVTPMGWGLMYFMVPIILKKPIWSHSLSIIGFWALAFFYPLSGVHHFLLSPIPMYVQYGAILATIAIEVVVTTVIINFFATLWGRWDTVRKNLPIRWFYTGMVFYFITCLQCSWHTTVHAQKIIHFTDWVPGHAHMVMFGVFAFWIIGAFTWLWPRVVGREWWSQSLLTWQYWLSVIGLTVMFLDLTAAGLVHGFMQAGLDPWLDIIRALIPFWFVRAIAGGMIIAGGGCQIWNMWKTARSNGPLYDEANHVADAPRWKWSPAMDSFKSIFFVAGIGMFVLAFLASALLPILTLSDLEYQSLEELAAKPTPEWRDLAERWPDAFQEAFGVEAWEQSALLSKRPGEAPADPTAVAASLAAYASALDQGRDVYVREACWHCHSQYVRGVSKEEQRWGPVAMAAEYQNALQRPHMWGTRRVGPDLSREWGVRTNDWHAAHLLDPKATSPDSVMPAYAWLFDDDPAWRPEAEIRAQAEALPDAERAAFLRRELARTPQAPNRDGLSLIAYLQWLGSWIPERPWDELP